MKQAFGLFAIGAAIAVLQGAVASFVPQHWCPDFGLLFVLAIGLSIRGTATGVCLSAALGYTTDLLSGAPLGLHAVLRLFAFAAARLGSRHLSLLGSMPAATFAALLTVANGVGTVWLTGWFVGGPGVEWSFVSALVPQAVANALVSPLVLALTRQAISLLSDEESGRRLVKFESGGWPA